MAPEQQAALAAARAGHALHGAVDGRADIYALGIVLCEMLAGERPPAHSPTQALRRCNFRVPADLAGLLGRCIAREPSERVAIAGQLAADLRRHLANLPLRSVANRNPVERWRKWRRRRPYSLPLLVLILAGLLAASLWGAQNVRQTRAARDALREGEAHLVEYRYEEALDAFKYGAALVNAMPFNDDLAARLQDGARRAEKELALRQLHALVELLRPLHGMEILPPDHLRTVEAQCRKVWQEREWFASRQGKSRESDFDEQVRADLLDLAIVYANLRVRLQTRSEAAARQDALAILAEAERTCGTSCVLDMERKLHAVALGQVELAKQSERLAASRPPRGAWEHYALGRALLRADAVPQALEHFDRALARQPQSLWANFGRGLAAYRLEQYEDAVRAFAICVALAPREAACWYNRGRAWVERGNFDQAASDLERAAQLGPAFEPIAALSLADLHRRHRQFDRAKAALERAREGGVPPAVVSYHLALVCLDQQDIAAAESNLREVLKLDPASEPARQLMRRLEQSR
jgi:tetratricopeptide (TPR) repeat protein